MAIGAQVRRMFGPLEAPVTDLYRAFFIDLSQQMTLVKRWVPSAASILEIGCGEGAVAQKLVTLYPTASITGIDISPKAGRLYRGDRSRVTFATTSAAEHAEVHAGQYDLILTCDVLHHVPWEQHATLLRQARTLLKPGGVFVLKDWEPIKNIGHIACEFSDRVLTGDDVRYGSESYFRTLLESTFGTDCVKAFTRVRPWRNNFMFLARPESA
ncbi:hypothetical protein BH11PLA2_BH11PLA2_05830 [soil metagenome]